MFVRFAILETPHIEPSRGVLQLADIRDYHEIALRHHRHDLRLHLLRYWYGLHLPDLSEVLHHTSASGRGVRIVLDVPLRQVLVCQLPMPRLKQVSYDVIGGLLVRIELRVAAVEQRLRIARAANGVLSVQRKAAGHESGAK